MDELYLGEVEPVIHAKLTSCDSKAVKAGSFENGTLRLH